MNNVPSPNIETPYRERALIGQLLDALRSLPDIFVNPPRWENLDPALHSRFDAEVDLIVAGREVTLLIEAKKTAYPRDVHQLLSQLRFLSRHDFLSSNSPKQISFLVAEAISPAIGESRRVGHPAALARRRSVGGTGLIVGASGESSRTVSAMGLSALCYLFATIGPACAGPRGAQRNCMQVGAWNFFDA